MEECVDPENNVLVLLVVYVFLYVYLIIYTYDFKHDDFKFNHFIIMIFIEIHYTKQVIHLITDNEMFTLHCIRFHKIHAEDAFDPGFRFVPIFEIWINVYN